MDLFNDDCLKVLKEMPDKSIDLFIQDLPYGCTNCDWDKKLDLKEFWAQLIRTAKSDKTPFIFWCTTRFGIDLINSNPKYFRHDFCWVKNRACGHLNSHRQPMRKHEMIYVFSKLSPNYDISSHLKDDNIKYIEKGREKNKSTSDLYSQKGKTCHNAKVYNVKLPDSIIKEDQELTDKLDLEKPYEMRTKGVYQQPTKAVKEYTEKVKATGIKGCYGKTNEKQSGGKQFKERLPMSVIKEKENESNSVYGPPHLYAGNRNKDIIIEPFPMSVLECKCPEKIKHSTPKPVEILKFLIKYYSKEGDVVCDPVMGSGSTGVACKEMNRHFIGMELDETIFNYAKERITNHSF